MSVLCLHAQVDSPDPKPTPRVDFLKPFTADSLTFQKPRPEWTYHPQTSGSRIPQLRLESFGQSGRMDQSNFDLNPSVITGANLHGLECPICAVGMLTRSRATLQPFGWKLTLNLLHGRVQLFSSFGGAEWWRPEGFLQGIGKQKLGGSPLSSALGGITALKVSSPDLSVHWGGAHLLSNGQYDDQWLLQSHFGAIAFLDPDRNVSVGITRGYLYNFGPSGMPSWSSTKADLTIRFDSIPLKALVRNVRKAKKIFRLK